MAKGIVNSAIVPRRQPTPYSGIKGDWFSIMYEVVTPENVQAWITSGE